MYFKHVAFCFLSWVTKHPLKDHRDIGHEIYRIVMNDHLPRNVEFVLVLRLDVVGGRFDSRSTAALELHRAYHGTSFLAISLGRIGWALMKNPITREFHFKPRSRALALRGAPFFRPLAFGAHSWRFDRQSPEDAASHGRCRAVIRDGA